MHEPSIVRPCFERYKRKKPHNRYKTIPYFSKQSLENISIVEVESVGICILKYHQLQLVLDLPLSPPVGFPFSLWNRVPCGLPFGKLARLGLNLQPRNTHLRPVLAERRVILYKIVGTVLQAPIEFSWEPIKVCAALDC